jgi:hypothetical protein
MLLKRIRMYYNFGNAGVGSDSSLSKLLIKENDHYISHQSGLTIDQNSTGDSVLHLINQGKRMSIGLNDTIFRMSRSLRLDANPLISIDPNYLSTSSLLTNTEVNLGDSGTNDWRSVCFSPELDIFVAVASSSGSTVGYSTNGMSWTGYSVSTGNYQSVCWSPELQLFTAVTNGSVIQSTGGIVWTSTGGNVDNLNSICWSPELRKFVGVGTNGFMYSATGSSWTATGSGSEYQSVCWAPEVRRFCGVGLTGAVSTSPDGENWTAQSALSGNLSSVCWSPELRKFCAVTNQGSYPYYYLSSTGTSWTAVTGSFHHSSVCWIPEASAFCAVGDSGTGSYSTNGGTSWSTMTMPNSNNYQSLCWSSTQGRLISVASNGATTRGAYSQSLYENQVNTTFHGPLRLDGLTTVLNSSQPYLTRATGASIIRTGVFASTGGRVVVGSSGPFTSRFTVVENSTGTSTGTGMTIYQTGTGDSGVMLSSAGSKMLINLDQSNSNKLQFCKGFDRYPMMGFQGTGDTREEGLSNGWTLRSAPEDYAIFGSILWIPTRNHFATCNSQDRGTERARFYFTETGGFNWIKSQVVSPPGVYDCYATSYDPVADVLVVSCSNGATALMYGYYYSTGVFSSLIGGSGTLVIITSIAYSPSLARFTAVGTDGSTSGARAYTSTTLTNWSEYSVTSARWKSVTWSPSLSLFCAVAESGGSYVMTSSNGTAWTDRTAASNTSWQSVCWSPELSIFCAVAASGAVMTSTNGTSWTSQTGASSDPWTSVTWAPEIGTFCAVSSTGTIMTSTNGVNWSLRSLSFTGGIQFSSVAWSPALGMFAAVASTGAARYATSEIYRSNKVEMTGAVTFQGTVVSNRNGNVCGSLFKPGSVFTNTFNTTCSATPVRNRYHRVGNIVFVSGKAVVHQTSTTKSFRFRMTPPIYRASNFSATAFTNCIGGGTCPDSTNRINVRVYEHVLDQCIYVEGVCSAATIASGTVLDCYYNYSYSLI